MTPVDEDTGHRLLTAEQASHRASIGLRTWHAYTARNYAPKPDGRIGRTPVWFEATIETWLKDRTP